MGWASGHQFESHGYVMISQSILWVGAYVPKFVQQLMLASLLSLVGWLLSLLVYFTIDNIIIGCIVAFVVILCIVGVQLLFISPTAHDPRIPTFMPLWVAPPDTVADRARSVMQRVQLEEDDESDEDLLALSEKFASQRAGTAASVSAGAGGRPAPLSLNIEEYFGAAAGAISNEEVDDEDDYDDERDSEESGSEPDYTRVDIRHASPAPHIGPRSFRGRGLGGG